MYYLLAIVLVVLGILMQLEIFILDDFKVACLNVSALFFTISGISSGSIFHKVHKAISTAVQYIMITLGGIYFLLAIIGSGFIWYKEINNHMLQIDSNAVLMIALGATIGAIVLNRKFSENRAKADNSKITMLNHEILNLKQKINDKDMKHIELVESYNALNSQNRTLIKKLNQTTKVMEQVNRKIDGGKQKDE
ncbi:hypothetical protein [Paenibacillus sp. 2TAB19]|uniref:hypothetical protein n=1 Tax=Paenibacillus sp. 2TAB19 TaxID=3233003 RepID=UPI003F9998BE